MRDIAQRFFWLSLVLVPGSAFAQPPGGGGGGMRGGGMGMGGGLPVGLDLAKVPAGSWAEYNTTMGEQPPRKSKVALVGKDKNGVVLEQSSFLAGGTMVSHSVVQGDPSAEGAVKQLIIQVGTSDPMLMPAAADGQGGPGGRRPGGRFVKLDPKTLVGKETLKVAAGSFNTQHYKNTGPDGATTEYWVSPDAGPLGLVKMLRTPPKDAAPGAAPGNPQAANGDRGPRGPRGPVTMELAARGKDAKPVVTKAPKPFDEESFRNSMQGLRQR